MIRRAALLGLSIAGLMCSDVYAADPVELVKNAQQAGKHVSYRGMKTANVYFGGVHTTSTMKVLHMKPDKTRTDFFTPGAIAGVIVIQNGDDIWTYSPVLDAWEQRSPAIKYSPDALLPDLTKSFDLKLAGKETVAGRSTYIVHAAPKNRAEAGRRLWIDESTHLIVKSQIEDRNGTVLNSSRYTSIDINPKDISPDAFRIDGRIAAQSKASSTTFRTVTPKYLPSGYKLIATSMITINDTACAHMQYSNGTNIISLFQRKGDADKDKSPAPIKSNVANVLTWAQDGMVFTLIADVSSRELNKIAESMR